MRPLRPRVHRRECASPRGPATNGARVSVPEKPAVMFRGTGSGTATLGDPIPSVHEAESQRTDDPIWTEVPDATDVPDITHRGAVDSAHDWLARFITPLEALDLDLLTLWAAHCHFVAQVGTTPRLLVTSPLPESGKTTCLEHLERLTPNAVQMGSVSSGAMLARLVSTGDAVLLIDEADRNLRPDREGVPELLAILNSGYKRGATRPTTVPDGSNGWRVEKLPTFAPVALAGITPNLPADTATRTVRLTILPDSDGLAEDSDWEMIEDQALAVGQALADWAATVSLPRPDLPESVRGRAKERWRPLFRVAHAAGGDWPARCLALIAREAAELDHDKEMGVTSQPLAVALLADVVAQWPLDVEAWQTQAMAQALAMRIPERWGPSPQYPQGLTVQRIGRHLSKNFQLRTGKDAAGLKVGYYRAQVFDAARRIGLTPPGETSGTSVSAGTSAPSRGTSSGTPARHTLETSPLARGENEETQRKPNPKGGTK